jgi:hypothetical protein
MVFTASAVNHERPAASKESSMPQLKTNILKVATVRATVISAAKMFESCRRRASLHLDRSHLLREASR